MVLASWGAGATAAPVLRTTRSAIARLQARDPISPRSS
jgi:hypothetical protein